MNIAEAAKALNGSEYRAEGDYDLFKAMKAANLVAVFGASDDLMEFRGAVYDEVGAWEGGKASFTRSGLLENECDDEFCPHFKKQSENAAKVVLEWAPMNFDGSWLAKTDLPHSPFDVMEDGELYCRGLVFSLDDCPTA